MHLRYLFGAQRAFNNGRSLQFKVQSNPLDADGRVSSPERILTEI